MKGIEEIKWNKQILALIIRKEAVEKLEEPLLFTTPPEFPLQVGIHHRQEQAKIKAHAHLPFSELSNLPVQEFFHLVSGKVKIDLYDQDNNWVKEVIVNGGDYALLNTGHGFTFLEKSKMIELKQGPYRGKEQEKKEIPERGGI